MRATVVMSLYALGLLLPAAAVGADKACVTIQEGMLVNSAGELLGTGYDYWGYNYQAHLFNGGYCDAYRDAAWCQPYRDVGLVMKWNDAWLSNEDCDGDGELDRHYGRDGYIGSGAWLTNHQSSTYYNDHGRKCFSNYLVKIVAVPTGASLDNGVWYDESGAELGPVIWGSFAIVQEVENDPCAGFHGLIYKATRPGLGNWESEPEPLPLD